MKKTKVVGEATETVAKTKSAVKDVKAVQLSHEQIAQLAHKFWGTILKVWTSMLPFTSVAAENQTAYQISLQIFW